MTAEDEGEEGERGAGGGTLREGGEGASVTGQQCVQQAERVGRRQEAPAPFLYN